MAAALNWDPVNLIIYETGTASDGNTEWNIRDDFYGGWKTYEQTLTNQQRAEFPRFMRYEGASPITPVQDTGSTFFMMDGWKFRPGEWDHEVTLEGNLWADPFYNDLYLPTTGAYTVLIKLQVSNLVDSSVARLDLNQLLQGIYFDAVNGTAGTGDENGTPTNPTNNNADLWTLLTQRNLSTVYINGNFTLDQDATEYTFNGLGNSLSNSFALGGYDVDSSLFEGLNLSGTMQGRIEARRCGLNVLAGVDGVFQDCGLINDFELAASSNCIFRDCYSEIAGTDTVEMTMATGAMAQFRNYSGGLEVRAFGATNLASFDLDPGHLILNADCTGGALVLRGMGRRTRNDGGAVAVTEDGFISLENVGGAVWDDVLVDHTTVGTFGYHVQNLTVGGGGATYIDPDLEVYIVEPNLEATVETTTLDLDVPLALLPEVAAADITLTLPATLTLDVGC